MRVSIVLSVCALAALLSTTSCSLGGGVPGTSGTFDATGAWSGTSTTGGYSSAFTAQVVQNGSTLSGTISIPSIGMTNAALSGAVSGDSVQFGDIAKTISFSGTAQADDTAEGTFSLSYGGSTMAGTWTGSCLRSLSLVATVTIPSGAGSGVGLAWDGSRLWVSSSQQLAVLSTDGTLLASYMYNDLQFPYHDFQCLAFDGSSMWATEDNSGPSYDKARLYAISVSDGAISTSVSAPPDGSATNMSGSIGLGLAWNGSSLWCLRNPASGTQTIYRIDRTSGAVVGSFPSPAGFYGSIMAGGFGAADGDLWISDRVGYLYRIRSSDGHIMHRFDFHASAGSMSATPAGIAWDGNHLWVRDMYGASLYRFAVPTGRIH